ncbi:carboxypeptidase-like regulatory domain-containing protein [Ferruginibacter sp.]
MRQLILIFFTGLFSFDSYAQVKGSTKDAEGAAIKSATISLLAAKDSAIVKLAVSNTTGDYQFANLTAGKYLVKASYVGYQPVFSAPFEVSTAAVIVPDLKLMKTAANLKGVVVTSQKPLLEMKADKMIMNVEGSINAVGSDALELLRKSPGVLVDKDDNLSLSGKKWGAGLCGWQAIATKRTRPGQLFKNLKLIADRSY